MESLTMTWIASSELGQAAGLVILTSLLLATTTDLTLKLSCTLEMESSHLLL